MAIESVNSVMAYQAQGAQKSEAVRNEERERNLSDKEVITEETQKNPDAVTAAVGEARESDEKEKEKSQNREEESRNQLPSNEKIKKTIEELNKKLGDSEAVFGVHEKTRRFTIKIIEKETKKVIKEYPPEETLDMIARIWEQAGLMVDERR